VQPEIIGSNYSLKKIKLLSKPPEYLSAHPERLLLLPFRLFFPLPEQIKAGENKLKVPPPLF
jgi:hypothetical protein